MDKKFAENNKMIKQFPNSPHSAGKRSESLITHVQDRARQKTDRNSTIIRLSRLGWTLLIAKKEL